MIQRAPYIMTHDELLNHISTAWHTQRTARGGLTADLVDVCWPGGPQDRTIPAARAWLRYWRPHRAVVSPPVCSCAAGHCAICN